MTEYMLRSARFLCAEALERILSPGDRVIDATMGNGHDTLRLCELVGEEGHVDAFDIQQLALDRTMARLRESGLDDRVSLHLTGHENMEEFVTPGVDLTVFNLGWLPGSPDKTVTTRLETTLRALEAALRIARKGGLITVCAYPGHAEGQRELDSILAWTERLRSDEVQVMLQRYVNQPSAPALLALVKLKEQVTLP